MWVALLYHGTPKTQPGRSYTIIEMLLLPGYSDGILVYEGAEASIYRARRIADDRSVIIKVLTAEYPTAKQLARFEHEYQILHGLRGCAAVLDVLDLHRHSGTLAMVLEDFGGLPLTHESFVSQSKVAVTVELSIAFAQALSEVHQRDTVHNAVAPENFLWDAQTRRAKLIDFGLASSEHDRGARASITTSLSPRVLAYVSPEQTGRLSGSVDQRSDLYSLGVVLFQLATGVPPFVFDDPMDLIHAHIALQPRVPSKVVHGAGSVVLSNIIMKLLSKSPEARYQSGSGLAYDLILLRDALAKGGKIPEIRLGEGDFASRLPTPAQLYGREPELAALNEAFDQARQGQRGLVLVAGYSGIGKSALVQAMNGRFLDGHAYFCTGKFGQLERHIPYGAVCKAGDALIQQILTEPEYRLDECRQRLSKNLGANAQIIIDVIPSLEIIIGKQPPVKPLTSTEAQNRFHVTFRKFLRTFATIDHPLVLFLDDLQWSDFPTLQLIRNLIVVDDLQHFLLVGAYRDEEVDDQHSMVATIAQIEVQHEVRILQLGPLARSTLNQMLADMFQRELDATAALAELIDKKTRGNPFFIRKVIERLYQERALRFDYGSRALGVELGTAARGRHQRQRGGAHRRAARANLGRDQGLSATRVVSR